MTTMNKRKRESQDIAGNRTAPAMNQMGNDFEQHYLQTDEDGMGNAGIDFTALGQSTDPTDSTNQGAAQMHVQGVDGQTASDTAAAAMAQYHTMTVPQSTEQSFMTQTNEGDMNKGSLDQGGSSAQQRTSNFADFDVSQVESSPNGDASPSTGAARINPLAAGNFGPKPAVGTEEWHKVRKDNHKEVERRRRETINEGINELAKIVPGCEKNKGSILSRAVQFITTLKENESQNIEKWTLEKLLTEQAIQELSSSCDKLKAECQRAWTECEQWKKAAQKAGLSIDGDSKGDADAEDVE